MGQYGWQIYKVTKPSLKTKTHTHMTQKVQVITVLTLIAEENSGIESR